LKNDCQTKQTQLKEQDKKLKELKISCTKKHEFNKPNEIDK